MFLAVPLTEGHERVEPRVTLLSMTVDPIRVMTAANDMYKGKPVRNPAEVSMDEAIAFIDDALRSKIAAPLEFCHFHFLFEGVTRAFTHQLVRQRTATYVQESMRFAVKSNAAWEVAEPPSLIGLPDDHPWVVVWRDAVTRMAGSYNMLVDAGMPAEDARGLLPTNIATRIHYQTNLRDLVNHAGLRLCSQAQFEWKQVWNLIIKAIMGHPVPAGEAWQQRAIVNLFRPVCYATGKCEFMGAADRWCVIRDRVEAHHRAGEPPAGWTDINPTECLRPDAARKRA
jgi:flavin-dependent thymidylate synthase